MNFREPFPYPDGRQHYGFEYFCQRSPPASFETEVVDFLENHFANLLVISRPNDEFSEKQTPEQFITQLQRNVYSD